MGTDKGQCELLGTEAGHDSGCIFINGRCRLLTKEGVRAVVVSGLPIAHYHVGDRMAEAYAMVCLVDQGLALQTEVARSFKCSDRSVYRYRWRFDEGGLPALGRPVGYPRGRPRLPGSRVTNVNKWKAEGMSGREIAQRLGVNEKAVRKLLARLGWKPEAACEAQVELPLAADPNLSGSPTAEAAGLDGPSPSAFSESPPPVEAADPNVSGEAAAPVRPSQDPDPANRSFDRLLACMGLLEDATPLFHQGTRVPRAGVLVALPALVQSGVFEIAREVYGSLAPAFYGLRTTLVAFLFMALLRIKRSENLKEHDPAQLGRLLGLDRAPEVKTLRRKLARLAACGRATQFGRTLAQQRVRTHGEVLGFLYVDGHVRVYHGKHKLPKGHVARMRISMPATTDYWVNDQRGDPLFVVNTEANPGLVQVLPQVLAEVRTLVGDKRVTVVFDRGGWSPKLFVKLIAAGFDILTYRKGRHRPVPKRRFSTHQGTIDGHTVRYDLADQTILLDHRKLKLRQVTRRSDDRHQTAVVTSRWDLAPVEVAYWMFGRWRQENFFKYLREEYALDALVDYGIEAADAERDVPNPARKKLDAQIHEANRELTHLEGLFGVEAHQNQEEKRSTMRGFKIAHAQLNRQIQAALERLIKLERKRAATPSRVPLKKIATEEIIKLDVERKHLTDLLKMVAYQAESELFRLIAPHYTRNEDEGRTLIQNILGAAGNIDVVGRELRVSIEPLSSPHRTQALSTLCAKLNQGRTTYPGSNLHLHFEVLPLPQSSMAFPGPNAPQPDTLRRG